MRTVVKVFLGEYDLTSKAKLRAEFEALCTEPKLILDMRGVSYVDSTFATELLWLHKCRVEKGIGGVSIVRSALIVKRLFAILNFKTLFRVADTLEELLPRDGSPIVVQRACRGDDALLLSPPARAAVAATPLPAWDSVVVTSAV
jgi:anti-anti-sigma factor